MRCLELIVAVGVFLMLPLVNATTKGLSQIVTPDLQPAGDLSLSFQAQSLHIANPYGLQAELGLTKFAGNRGLQGVQTKQTVFRYRDRPADQGAVSARENSSTIGFTWKITPDFQANPAIYFPNYHTERILGCIFFTYTSHLWAKDKQKRDQTVPGGVGFKVFYLNL